MAQISTDNIHGFSEMSAEEQVKALLAFEYDDGAEKVKAAEDNAAKLKAAMDKAASEAAAYKKQLNATKSEEELKRLENEEALKAMQEKLAEYEQRDKISTAKAALLGKGFGEDIVLDAANAFIGGDIEEFCKVLEKYRATIETSTKSALMGNNPKPESGAKNDDAADNGKDVSIAEQLGQVQAERQKQARNILDKYLTRR